MKIENERDWELIFRQAEVLYQKGAVIEAMTAYRDLLSYRVIQQDDWQAAFSNYDAIVVERLADLSILLGRSKTADQLLLGLQELAKRHGNSFLNTYLVSKRATIKLTEGQLEEAAALLEDSIGNLDTIPAANLAGWEQTGPLGIFSGREQRLLASRVHFVLGKLLLHLGQYQSSLHFLKRALMIFQSPDFEEGQAQVPTVLLEIAKAEFEEGAFHAAKESLLAIRPAEETPIRSAFITQWHNLWASLHYVLGDFGIAKSTMAALVVSCEEQQLWLATLRARCNLAQLAIFLNQINLVTFELAAARKLVPYLEEKVVWEDRISQLEVTAQHRFRAASSPLTLGSGISATRFVRLQDGSAAQERLQVQSWPEQVGGHLDYFESCALHWQLLLSNQQGIAAEQAWQELQQIFQYTDSRYIHARLTDLALLRALLMGEVAQELLSSVQDVQRYYRAANIGPELWQLQRFMSWYEGYSEEEKNLLIEQNQQLLDRMTASLEQTEQSLYLLNKWQPNEEYLLGCLEKLDTTKERTMETSFPLVRWWRSYQLKRRLALFQEDIDRHKSILVNEKLTKRTFNSTDKRQPIPWLKHYFGMAKDRAELAFLVLPDRVVVTMRWRFCYRYIVLDVSRLQLRSWVKMWHEQMENQGRNFRWLAPLSPAPQQEEKEDILAQITAAFRLPALLAMLPTSVKRLTLVVDDILHALPWGGLSWDNAFLIERYALSFRFSAGVPDTKARVKEGYFLLGATETLGMPPLPGVEKEVTVINDLWQQAEKKSVHKWVNKAFTKPALDNAMAYAHVVHLACHGTFDTADPGNSGIILPDGERYSLREVLNQQNSIVIDHLTLSSCWAADQYILPGRWVISLPEVFYRIGTGSILASLWEVEDHWSVVFMNAFYEKSARLPRDLAFQEALIENMGGKSYSDKRKNIPRWSGMQLFGSQLGHL